MGLGNIKATATDKHTSEHTPGPAYHPGESSPHQGRKVDTMDIYDQLKAILSEHEQYEKDRYELRRLYRQMEEIVSICQEPTDNGDKVARILSIARDAAGM